MRPDPETKDHSPVSGEDNSAVICVSKTNVSSWSVPAKATGFSLIAIVVVAVLVHPPALVTVRV